MVSFLALAIAAASGPAICPGTTTIQVDACFEARLKTTDATLNRYFQTALKRARKESGEDAAQKLVRAERSWTTYRNAECGSVFDYWSGGTIRTSMELDCRIRLTRLRAYAIWRDWLTYAGSTPPLLARPDIESVTSDR